MPCARKRSPTFRATWAAAGRWATAVCTPGAAVMNVAPPVKPGSGIVEVIVSGSSVPAVSRWDGPEECRFEAG